MAFRSHREAVRHASTDTTRKIDTLRRWSKFTDQHEKMAYLNDIADELDRVYQLMINARRRLMLIDRYPNSRWVKVLARIV